MESAMKKTRQILKEDGLTLMELAVGIFVTTLMVASTLPFFKVTMDSVTSVHRGKLMYQNARIAMTRMVAEIRAIDEPNDIREARDDEIEFNHPSGERVHYWLYTDDNMIIREIEGVFWDNRRPLMLEARSLEFEYYDSDGNLMTTPFWFDKTVRRIRIAVELDVNGDGADLVQYVTQVTPRHW